MSFASPNLSAADRPLELRARGDWEIVRVEFSGQPAYVAKDPVTLETVQLSAEEHFLWEQLRQTTSLAELRRAFEQRFAPRRVTDVALQQFIASLHRQGLVVSDRPGQGGELLTRDRERRGAQRWARLLQVFAIRLGGFPAGPTVDKLYRVLRPAFSWAGVVAAAALCAAALATVATHGEQLVARLPALSELFAPRRWPLWLATFAAVKVLHELGHALALRHFGGHCREIGVLLLAGMPALYCDASDAWRLPSKWRRMAVSAAGMTVELLLASAAVLVWSFAHEGLVSALALSVAVVCSVNTLAINANPLLRYDGYYLLADWLEVPNLADRSRGLIRGGWRRWLLAEPGVDEPLLAPGKRRVLVGYAVASICYGLIVLGLIVAMLLKVARPYRAESLVYAAAGLAALGHVFAPLRAAGQVWRDPRQRRRLRPARLTVAVVLVVAAAWGVWSWPIARRVEAPALLTAAGAHPVFTSAAGWIQPHAAPGAEVAAGDLIATLVNPELQLANVEQEGVANVARVRVAQLRTLRAAGASAGAALPTAMAELADAKSQLAERRRAAEQLEIRAPAAGRLLSPPPRPADVADAERLGAWSGTALAERNRGAWIEPGVALAVVAPAGEQLVWAAIDTADVSSVAAGQPVRIVFEQAPLQVFTGEVRRVTRRVRTADDDRHPTGEQRPNGSTRTSHIAEIALDAPSSALLPGARGTVKIETSRTTIGWLIRRELAELFRLPW